MKKIMNDPDSLQLAREQWRWRGKDHPFFAEVPKEGQVSVWDFPRPPELIRDKREILVRWGKYPGGSNTWRLGCQGDCTPAYFLSSAGGRRQDIFALCR